MTWTWIYAYKAYNFLSVEEQEKLEPYYQRVWLTLKTAGIKTRQELKEFYKEKNYDLVRLLERTAKDEIIYRHGSLLVDKVFLDFSHTLPLPAH